MRIDNVTIRNYKDFFEPAEISLSSGLNVVIGQNSSGKTTLLQALTLSFEARPNKSLSTWPDRTFQPNPTSSVSFSLHLSRAELMELMRLTGSQFFLALPSIVQAQALRTGTKIRQWDQQSIANFTRWFLETPNHLFRLTRRVGGNATEWSPQDVVSHGRFIPENMPGGSILHATIKVLRDNSLDVGATSMAGIVDLGAQVAPNARGRIYRFSSERFIPAISPHGDSNLLAGNASNLAEVLNRLQHNRTKFDEFNRIVAEILPQVKYVSVRPFGGSQNEVVVWHHDPATARDDLVVSLSDTGSGVAQVLALLYVVFTSEFPRTILIDEPQTFLHPGALRKLIEVLGRYRDHQFIVTTHSPTVIAASHPRTILMLTGTQEVTCQCLNGEVADALRLSLNEVGARLSDVFGADNILWVEGVTEETCFPIILRTLGNRSLMGTAIIGVRRTGDLEGKDAERVFEIYEDISASSILLPPAIGFIFDRENRTAQQQRELIHRSGNRLSFLPRRMYENYLLNPGAIAQVINSLDRERPQPLTTGEVTQFLEDRHLNPTYFEAAPEEASWRNNIDAARVLKDCFRHFTEARVHFDKVIHGHELTKWLCANSPADFGELYELIEVRLHTN